MEDQKMLSEALAAVKTNQVQMKRCLDNDQLMDALKSASTMLGELRTSSLTPKQYYELYMAVFDALRHLSTYLYDAHTTGKHHLADLYELVQYAGNIVPRLYLMITVGSVYMSIPDAPIKEIMKDIMEMSRGVQHPTRGLFLRHYMSGQTRDYLPIGSDDGPNGNLHDSIGFVLTNFIEMNKLWVRLQHQGHSRDREKREMERKELRILVGTNLVRLSQLDGVDLDMYQRIILPSILEQVVNCKDVIAQEYLMEVVIQVFTDEFHLRTLGPFLSATAQLHPKVNIKQIVIALIDRLAAYASREADNESPEEIKRQEEEAARRLAEKVHAQRRRATAGGAAVSEDGTPASGAAVSPPPLEEMENGFATAADGSADADKEITTPAPAEEAEGEEKEKEEGEGSEPPKDKGKAKEVVSPEVETKPVRKFRGIPEDVKLFEVFWHQVVELIKARPDLSIQDITALLVSLVNLSLSCYPDKLEYVDQVLGFARSKMQEFADSPDLHSPQTTSNLLSLLLSPINSYQTVLTLLALPNYQALLAVQPYSTRRSIAHALVSSVLKNETVIDMPEDVQGLLDMCGVLIRDQKDAPIGPGGSAYGRGARGVAQYDAEEMAEEQGWVARMVHLFRADQLDVQFALLQTARKQFADGGERIRYTFPPLIVAGIKLARRFKAREHVENDWEQRTSALFKFIHQLISILYHKVEASDICLRLFLLAAQAADESGREDLCYSLACEALTIYEESIVESRAQLQAIALIIRTLQTMRVFSADNYDTLITKVALHGAKLLKKSHQATAVCLASHLWWQTEVPGREVQEDKPPYRDGKRVLECLQKSLRIASSVIDPVTTVQLYVDALDRYLYYFEQGVEEITARYVNSLIELITTNLDEMDSPDSHPSSVSASAPGLIEGAFSADAVRRHFRNTLKFVLDKREDAEGDARERWQDVDIAGPCLKLGITR